jgi:hypothetical protein
VAGATEDQVYDADREVGVVDLDIVIAAGHKDVRGERFEVDEQGLDLRPRLFELSRPLFSITTTWPGDLPPRKRRRRGLE